MTLSGGFSITLDPGNSDKLWCGGRHYTGKTFGMGIMKTNAAGNEWPDITWNNYRLTTSGDGRVCIIAIDPSNGNIAYAGGNRGGGSTGGVEKAALFKTVNGGSNWQNITDSEFGKVVYDLKIDSVNPDILYAATSVDVFKSVDAGVSWTKTYCYPARALLICNTNDSSTIYAGTDSNGVWFSKDAGETWNEMNAGLTDSEKRIKKLSINPGNYLFAGTANTGVYRWNLGGAVDAKSYKVKSLVQQGFSVTSINAGQVVISFTLVQYSQVKLSLFDIRGREITALVNGWLNEGIHSVNLNKNVDKISKGVYICRMQVGYKNIIKSLIIK